MDESYRGGGCEYNGLSNRIKKILASLYVFVFIFSPPIIPNARFVCDALNVAFLIIYFLYKNRIILFDSIKITVIPFVPFLIYIWWNAFSFIFFEKPDSIWQYDNLEFIKTAIFPIYIWVRIMALCYVLKLIKEKNNLNMDSFTDLIIYAGILQFFCVLLAFTFPSIRDAFLQLMAANTEGKIQSDILIDLGGDKRSYGFATNLYDSIGYIMAFITALSFIKAISRNSIKYFIAFCCLLLVALLNTRTGLLLDAICVLIVSVFFSKGGVRFLAKLSMAIIVLIGCGSYVLSILPETTFNWAMEGVDSIYYLLVNQEYSGIFLTFYLKHLNFPMDIIFGDGAIPDAALFNVSDIGYIQCLWRYGIIGTMILLCGGMYFFCLSYKLMRNDREMKCFILCSSVIFFVYMLKLFSLYNLGGYASFVPAILLYVLEYESKGDCRRK